MPPDPDRPPSHGERLPDLRETTPGPVEGVGPGASERRIFVRDLPWRFLEGGAGEPLLFLHGGGAMGQTWCGAFPFLARRHRVVLPDLPGFGATPADPGLKALTDVMTRLEEYLPAVGFQTGVVLGNSLGGYLAVALALREPARFRAVVLLAPAGFDPGGGKGSSVSYPVPGTMNRALFHRPSQVAGCFPRVPPEEASRRARSARETTRRWLTGGFPPLPLEDLLPPVLLLWGNEDRILPVTIAPQVRDQFPRAKLRILEGCGHVPTWESPELVATEVEDFLARSEILQGSASPPGSSRPTGSKGRGGGPSRP